MALSITDVSGVGPATAKTLSKHKIRTVPELATVAEDSLASIPGFGGGRAQKLIDAARSLLAEGDAPSGAVRAPAQVKKDKPEKKGKKEKKEKKEKKKDKKRKKDKKKDKKDKKKGKKDRKGK